MGVWGQGHNQAYHLHRKALNILPSPKTGSRNKCAGPQEGGQKWVCRSRSLPVLLLLVLIQKPKK